VTELGSGPLEDFLSVLGLQAGQAHETPNHLRVSAQVKGAKLKQLEYSLAGQLLTAYGPSLSAKFYLQQDYRDLLIEPGLTRDSFSEQMQGIDQAATYGLELSIDKQALALAVLGPELARGSVHYFFAASVQDLLCEGLDCLERAIWEDTAEARRILIGDTDLDLSGPALQVAGGSKLTTLAPLGPLPESVSDSIERIRADREEQISWDYQWVQRLTPVQLQLDGEPGGTCLQLLLAAAYVQLCLLYTCDRARRRQLPDGRWEARPEYRGGQAVARVVVEEGQPLDTPVTAADIAAFAGLTDWCYRLRDEGAARDWTADRLEFAQVRIAILLESVPEASRLAALVRRVPDIRAGLNEQWRAFVEDKLTQYVDKERQLEGIVDNVVVAYGEKVTALAKSLSDTMLAAVATLLGSAIAAAFKAPFDATLFRVGVLTYAGYVLLFPGLYGLSSHVGQFLEVGRVLDAARPRFDDLLGPAQASQIIGNRVTTARARYWRWLSFTAAGYLVAIAAAIVAAVVVPSIVR
jgi:hypothetical protein